jgi:hypothetical protein
MSLEKADSSELANDMGIAGIDQPTSSPRCEQNMPQDAMSKGQNETIMPYDGNMGFGPSLETEEEAFDAGFGHYYLMVEASAGTAGVMEALAEFIRAAPSRPQTPLGVLVDLFSSIEGEELERFATANPGVRIYSVDYSENDMFIRTPRPKNDAPLFPTPRATARRALQRAVASCILAEHAAFVFEGSPIGDVIATARRQVTKALEAVVASSPEKTA